VIVAPVDPWNTRVGGEETRNSARLKPRTVYGPDRAIVTSGNARGNPIEFVRDDAGRVAWMEYIGRIAKKGR
jgi:hypothetical protein